MSIQRKNRGSERVSDKLSLSCPYGVRSSNPGLRCLVQFPVSTPYSLSILVCGGGAGGGPRTRKSGWILKSGGVRQEVKLRISENQS